MITVASCITMFRIVLTPVVISYIYLQQWSVAALFFIIAALTDVLDGFIARIAHGYSYKFLSTSFGMVLDCKGSYFALWRIIFEVTL